MNARNIAINSTLLFSIATIWQQSLHEFGHLVAGILFHSEERMLFHNYVRHDISAVSDTGKIVIAAAGPLLSLALGALFQALCSRYSGRDWRYLFFLYMSVFGYINFGGYLLTSPFFVYGDIGFIFEQFHFNLWIKILFALLGAVFLFYMMKNMSGYFAAMATEAVISDKASRRKFISSLVENPIYFGIIVTILMNLPVPTFLSLLYPACSPFTLFWAFGYLLESKYEVQYASEEEFRRYSAISYPVIAAFVLTLVVNRVMAAGIGF